jgi:hypothetical protein
MGVSIPCPLREQMSRTRVHIARPIGGPTSRNTEWLQTYDITADQASAVAEGYADQRFYPDMVVVRARCAKMIMDGFGIATATPATPSFVNVP